LAQDHGVQAMKTRPKSSRGKPQPRPAVPMYDKDMLKQVLFEQVQKRGVENAFEMGTYLNLPVSHAVRGSALAQLCPVMLILVKVSPFMMFLYKVFEVKHARETLCFFVYVFIHGIRFCSRTQRQYSRSCS
jgi:hypothetical protein